MTDQEYEQFEYFRDNADNMTPEDRLAEIQRLLAVLGGGVDESWTKTHEIIAEAQGQGSD